MQEKNFDIIYIPFSSDTYGKREKSKITAIILHAVGLKLDEAIQTFQNYKVSTII